MIRCRRGNDFNYSDLEMEAMLDDMEFFKTAGADGFVRTLSFSNSWIFDLN